MLVCVIVISSLFAFYQSTSSAKVMEGFKKMIPLNTVVIRNGEKLVIEVRNLTLGDIVEIKGGDKVPAGPKIKFHAFFLVSHFRKKT